jgi:hypothetical protein
MDKAPKKTPVKDAIASTNAGEGIVPPALVTKHHAIDTSGKPPIDATGLPASRIVGHEEYEVGLSGVLKSVAWFIGLTLLSLVIVYYTLFGLVNQIKSEDGPKSAVASEQSLPPEPRLQPSRGHERTEHQDLVVLQARYAKTLSTYGWVDKSAGVVHIPIDEAMAKALNDPKVLPARADGKRPGN